MSLKNGRAFSCTNGMGSSDARRSSGAASGTAARLASSHLALEQVDL